MEGPVVQVLERVGKAVPGRPRRAEFVPIRRRRLERRTQRIDGTDHSRGDVVDQIPPDRQPVHRFASETLGDRPHPAALGPFLHKAALRSGTCETQRCNLVDRS